MKARANRTLFAAIIASGLLAAAIATPGCSPDRRDAEQLSRRTQQALPHVASYDPVTGEIGALNLQALRSTLPDGTPLTERTVHATDDFHFWYARTFIEDGRPNTLYTPLIVQGDLLVVDDAPRHSGWGCKTLYKCDNKCELTFGGSMDPVCTCTGTNCGDCDRDEQCEDALEVSFVAADIFVL